MHFVGPLVAHKKPGGALPGPVAEKIAKHRGKVVVVAQGTIDNRDPEKLLGGFAKGGLRIPMGQLEKRLGTLIQSKTDPLILICATQNRSSRLVEQLQAAGYTNVSYVKGGMSQWAARGWPMVKP